MDNSGEKYETWWRDHREWLESFGYKLRRNLISHPRPDQKYRSQFNPNMFMDAIRIVDGKRVMLKKVGPNELEISVFFKHSHATITKDARNHCTPIFDVLEVPYEEATAIVVMPFLRPFYTPRFETRGELLEFFRQIFEGMHFMHLYNTAHRNCSIENILMEGDGMYPHGFHPVWPNAALGCNGPAKKRSTRTRRPPRYYITGFETSCYFPPSVTNPLVYPSVDGDDPSTASQQQATTTPYDPFPADVYYLGNTIRSFLSGHGTQDRPVDGFQFLMPLLRDMTCQDAGQRPTMEEVVARYDRMLDTQSHWSLRSRVVYEGDEPPTIQKRIRYWGRQITSILQGLSALPTPR
ncbi:hypothetical protein APHAL10511_004203 [Amanita phalloides]|nr:hypothetical protein APHAL10511_004203 [Amanita phalloides]